MIDLHCHILPGVDDGAESLEEAAAMCRLAARDGCEAMVATPHQRRGEWWNADRESLTALADELQNAVGPGFRVYLGGEVHVDSELLAEVEKLPGGGLLPLAGSRYLLIELDSQGTARDAIHLVHELSVAGWYPILAHPELIPWLAPDPALIGRLVALGATTQVTAMSVTGDFGRRPQNDVFSLLDAGLVHFVASDAHGIRRRPPGLGRAHDLIAGRWGEDVAQRLVADNPRAVVTDRPLPGTV
jgi:protein-tyrosine phosphatase